MDASRKAHFPGGVPTADMIVPEDEVRKPSIYHSSRDVALKWVDNMSEEVLASVGITGPKQTVQFNMPGLPPFFGSGRREVVGGSCRIVGGGKCCRWGGNRYNVMLVVCIKHNAGDTRGRGAP